jgi:hypothetical protein
MSATDLLPMPTKDPVTGDELFVSELASDSSGITIRGRFAIPKFARLDADQARFLETFLRCRGMLNSVERELGISYPTVRARLDALLEALGLAPVRDESQKRDKVLEKRKKVLDRLEKGDITAEQAMAMLRGEASK